MVAHPGMHIALSKRIRKRDQFLTPSDLASIRGGGNETVNEEAAVQTPEAENRMLGGGGGGGMVEIEAFLGNVDLLGR